MRQQEKITKKLSSPKKQTASNDNKRPHHQHQPNHQNHHHHVPEDGARTTKKRAFAASGDYDEEFFAKIRKKQKMDQGTSSAPVATSGGPSKIQSKRQQKIKKQLKKRTKYTDEDQASESSSDQETEADDSSASLSPSSSIDYEKATTNTSKARIKSTTATAKKRADAAAEEVVEDYAADFANDGTANDKSDDDEEEEDDYAAAVTSKTASAKATNQRKTAAKTGANAELRRAHQAKVRAMVAHFPSNPLALELMEGRVSADACINRYFEVDSEGFSVDSSGHRVDAKGRRTKSGAVQVLDRATRGYLRLFLGSLINSSLRKDINTTTLNFIAEDRKFARNTLKDSLDWFEILKNEAVKITKQNARNLDPKRLAAKLQRIKSCWDEDVKLINDIYALREADPATILREKCPDKILGMNLKTLRKAVFGKILGCTPSAVKESQHEKCNTIIRALFKYFLDYVRCILVKAMLLTYCDSAKIECSGTPKPLNIKKALLNLIGAQSLFKNTSSKHLASVEVHKIVCTKIKSCFRIFTAETLLPLSENLSTHRVQVKFDGAILDTIGSIFVCFTHQFFSIAKSLSLIQHMVPNRAGSAESLSIADYSTAQFVLGGDFSADILKKAYDVFEMRGNPDFDINSHFQAIADAITLKNNNNGTDDSADKSGEASSTSSDEEQSATAMQQQQQQQQHRIHQTSSKSSRFASRNKNTYDSGDVCADSLNPVGAGKPPTAEQISDAEFVHQLHQLGTDDVHQEEQQQQQQQEHQYYDVFNLVSFGSPPMGLPGTNNSSNNNNNNNNNNTVTTSTVFSGEPDQHKQADQQNHCPGDGFTFIDTTETLVNRDVAAAAASSSDNQTQQQQQQQQVDSVLDFSSSSFFFRSIDIDDAGAEPICTTPVNFSTTAPATFNQVFTSSSSTTPTNNNLVHKKLLDEFSSFSAQD